MAWLILTSACTGTLGATDIDAGDARSGADGGLPGDTGRWDGGDHPAIGPTAVVAIERLSGDRRGLDGRGSIAGDAPIVSFRWTFGDGAEAVGDLVEHTYEPGCYDVTLTVTDAAGRSDVAEAQVAIGSGSPSDPIVTLDPLPRDGALLPRDLATDRGTFTVSGVLEGDGWEEIRARIARDGVDETVLSAPVCAGAFSLEVPIPAELARRDVRVSLATGEVEHEVATVTDLVAGDVFLIQGQSNAVAGFIGDFPGNTLASENVTPFVRSFGRRTTVPAESLADDRWRPADGDWGNDGDAAIGQWGLRMGRLLVEATGIPLAIVSGGRGGQSIDFFARDDEDPDDVSRNYGQLLERVRRAGIDGAVRAILFYQGEGDGGATDVHRAGFTALHEDWREDYGSTERFYVMQIRSGCGAPSPAFLDMQRRFAETLPRTTVMSTNGLDGHGPDECHYYFERGYEELGERLARLLARDLYGIEATDVEAIDVTGARRDGDVIRVDLSSDATRIDVDEGVAADFRVDGGRSVSSVRVVGSTLELTLASGAGAPSRVSYGGHPGAGRWIANANGVGLLSFDLPIE
jgi:hypothetical protein